MNINGTENGEKAQQLFQKKAIRHCKKKSWTICAWIRRTHERGHRVTPSTSLIGNVLYEFAALLINCLYN
jgi:hypothetical protein